MDLPPTSRPYNRLIRNAPRTWTIRARPVDRDLSRRTFAKCSSPVDPNRSAARRRTQIACHKRRVRRSWAELENTGRRKYADYGVFELLTKLYDGIPSTEKPFDAYTFYIRLIPSHYLGYILDR